MMQRKMRATDGERGCANRDARSINSPRRRRGDPTLDRLVSRTRGTYVGVESRRLGSPTGHVLSLDEICKKKYTPFALGRRE
jgi:hypothetical protein